MTPVAAGEIRLMEEVCQLAGRTLSYIEKYVQPGVTTNELDRIVYDFTKSNGAEPAPLNYHGFPKSICTSVNSCICHGVPNDIPLREGDIVNVDVTSMKNGFYGDTSATFYVGKVSDRGIRITEAAEEAMYRGIEEVRPGGTTGDIGFAIQKYVNKKNFYPVREIGGHGIGQKFHMDPFVPSYGKRGRGDKLIPFICITVEPMINETGVPIKELSIENSSIKYYETGDGSLSAQFEHTILVTDKSYQILTLRD